MVTDIRNIEFYNTPRRRRDDEGVRAAGGCAL